MPSKASLLLEDPAAARAGALLTIDLDAIAANYRKLCRILGPVDCAAVAKADAYGLGMERVGPVLYAAGARHFFVAHPDEAICLRGALGPDASACGLYVLNGLMPGAEGDYLDQGLVPVLNSPGDIERWAVMARKEGRRLPSVLHIDTGLCRLGLNAAELARIVEEPTRLDGLELRYVMSHLIMAEEQDAAANRAQLVDFRKALAGLPPSPASLANSSGIFLGAEYHFDLARPGVALYGVNPTPSLPNPMSQVVRLQGKILQVRDIDAPQSVGYGATHRAEGPARIATVAVGYADGYLRSLSNRGSALLGGQRVAVVGRVSMDLITLDVSPVAPSLAVPGALVDLIAPDQDVDRLAAQAGTIGHEILTALGRRYHRVYKES